MLNLAAIYRQVSPDLLLDISAVNCQRRMVNELGMIRKSYGDAQYITNGRGTRVALCAYPHSSNSNVPTAQTNDMPVKILTFTSSP
jgi:hypothetical protein